MFKAILYVATSQSMPFAVLDSQQESWHRVVQAKVNKNSELSFLECLSVIASPWIGELETVNVFMDSTSDTSYTYSYAKIIKGSV